MWLKIHVLSSKEQKFIIPFLLKNGIKTYRISNPKNVLHSRDLKF